MIGVYWNARGLGGPQAFCDLHRLIRETSPDLLFIFEYRISNHAVTILKSRLNFDNYFVVNHNGSKGGLFVMWQNSIRLSILSYSCGHIDCMLFYTSNSFYFTGSYDNPITNDHFLSWLLLKKIISTHTNAHLGWIVGGNFNEILFDHEKRWGIPRAFSQTNSFREALESLNLSSLAVIGPMFTWDNKRKHPN